MVRQVIRSDEEYGQASYRREQNIIDKESSQEWKETRSRLPAPRRKRVGDKSLPPIKTG